MGAKQRQLLNLAIFEKLYVIEDYVSDASYNAPFDELESLRRPGSQRPNRRDGSAAGRVWASWSTPFLGDGLSKAILVEQVQRLSNSLSDCETRRGCNKGEK